LLILQHPNTIKTKEKEDLSCITNETPSECYALIAAMGGKKTDCHLDGCENSFYFKANLKFNEALMIQCIQCYGVFCSVHNHTCEDRRSNRSKTKNQKFIHA